MSRTETRQTVEYQTVKTGYQDPEKALNQLAAYGWKVVEPIERGGDTWGFLLEREIGGGRDA